MRIAFFCPLFDGGQDQRSRQFVMDYEIIKGEVRFKVAVLSSHHTVLFVFNVEWVYFKMYGRCGVPAMSKLMVRWVFLSSP